RTSKTTRPAILRTRPTPWVQLLITSSSEILRDAFSTFVSRSHCVGTGTLSARTTQRTAVTARRTSGRALIKVTAGSRVGGYICYGSSSPENSKIQGSVLFEKRLGWE